MDISGMLMPDALREVSEALHVEDLRINAQARAFAKVMVGDG